MSQRATHTPSIAPKNVSCRQYVHGNILEEIFTIFAWNKIYDRIILVLESLEQKKLHSLDVFWFTKVKEDIEENVRLSIENILRFRGTTVFF